VEIATGSVFEVVLYWFSVKRRLGDRANAQWPAVYVLV
jgi:hypothetical protein